MSGSDSEEGFSFLCGLDDGDFDDVEEVDDEAPPPEKVPAVKVVESTNPEGVSTKESAVVVTRETVIEIRNVLALGQSIQLKCDWGVGIGGNLWT
jgi:hypothetical protein